MPVDRIQAMNNLEQYARFFSVGMRVGVGIPMQNNELFRDWAIIHGMEEDLVQLQLSRDVLPVDVDLQTGKLLEVRCGKEGLGYRCSGVYISDATDGYIQIRLTGEVHSSELREYYRIDAYLPFKLQVSQEHDLDAVLKEWRTRRQNRLAEETARKEELAIKRRELLFRTAAGEFDTEDWEAGKRAVPDPDESDLTDHSWDDVMATAVNLSAGGFRFVTSNHYEMQDLVYQEIFIPTNPPRIMDSVARVVFKNRNYFAGKDEEYYNIATQFLFIDERDRDAIVKYITNLELMRIRLLRKNRFFFDKAGAKKMITLYRVISATLLLTLFVAIFLYYQNYFNSNIKNEIQETFEKGIRMYLEKFK